MGTNLFVGNLAFSVTDQELRGVFEQIGPVVSAKVITDRDTGRSRGFGFVEMADEVVSREAISKLNGVESYGRRITVNEALPRPPRRSFGSSDGNGRPTFSRAGYDRR
ncbi:MAG: RNA-binding protein [Chloroflexi bacterium]|nr:RNA-binding protein [Chloroflexota bacterium]